MPGYDANTPGLLDQLLARLLSGNPQLAVPPELYPTENDQPYDALLRNLRARNPLSIPLTLESGIGRVEAPPEQRGRFPYDFIPFRNVVPSNTDVRLPTPQLPPQQLRERTPYRAPGDTAIRANLLPQVLRSLGLMGGYPDVHQPPLNAVPPDVPVPEPSSPMREMPGHRPMSPEEKQRLYEQWQQEFPELALLMSMVLRS